MIEKIMSKKTSKFSWKRSLTLDFLLLTSLCNASKEANDVTSKVKRHILVTPGTIMEIYLIFAYPLKTGKHDVTCGTFIVGNYAMATYGNQDVFIQPLQKLEESFMNGKPLWDRRRRNIPPPSRWHRGAIYRVIELLLEKFCGMNGRACLLRSICEAAEYNVAHDGLVGEILHVLLTPSTSLENVGLHSDYHGAEELGRRGASCRDNFPACPISPLEHVTTLTSWSSEYND